MPFMAIRRISAIIWSGLRPAKGESRGTLTAWVLAFVLFRLFDILKPWPICWLDKHVHGGFGVMLDDIAAALPCMLIIVALQHFQLLGR